MSTIMKISHMSQQKELEDKGFKVQVTKENNDDVEKVMSFLNLQKIKLLMKVLLYY